MILKLILYEDLFFWLLNCSLSNDDKYRFIAYLTRTFNADIFNNTANWKVNALLKLKNRLQAAINVILKESKNKNTLKLYKNMHIFSVYSAVCLKT